MLLSVLLGVTIFVTRWSVICQLTGHTGFVNAVASLKTTDDFPKGLIVTGGQDKVINIYCTGWLETYLGTGLFETF